jgi:hypothetical protein
MWKLVLLGRSTHTPVLGRCEGRITTWRLPLMVARTVTVAPELVRPVPPASMVMVG